MRLPRDPCDARFSLLLSRYGYEVARQTGDHLRLASSIKGSEHPITIPLHKELRFEGHAPVRVTNQVLVESKTWRKRYGASP